MSERATRYDRVAIALHWAIGIAIVVLGGVALLREPMFERGTFLRKALGAIHEPAALVVFLLILVRVVWRLSHRPPDLPSAMRPWEALAARLAHSALYLLMLAVPLLGLATSYARGRGIDFGLFSIPAFAPPLPRPTARLIKEVHEWAAIAILVLAGLHAAIALWHHHVRRDDVLARMLPR